MTRSQRSLQGPFGVSGGLGRVGVLGVRRAALASLLLWTGEGFFSVDVVALASRRLRGLCELATLVTWTGIFAVNASRVLLWA